MNGKEIDGKKLYVSEALKKLQLAKEIFKYKNSKKRCNLFVKGFPDDTTEEDLRNYFNQLCENKDSIESLKLEMDKKDPAKAKFAFVCFKNPEEANNVKIKAANHPDVKGRKIQINNYELKEIRKIQFEEIKDRAEYQNAVKPHM